MDVLFCNFVDRGRRLCSLRRTGGLVGRDRGEIPALKMLSAATSRSTRSRISSRTARSRDPTSATTTAGTEAGTSTPAEPGRD